MKNVFKFLPVLVAVFAASCGQKADTKETLLHPSASEQKAEIMYDVVVYSPKGDTLYHVVNNAEEGLEMTHDYGANIKDPTTGKYFYTTPGTVVTARPFLAKK
jgi:hypothetical protein